MAITPKFLQKITHPIAVLPALLLVLLSSAPAVAATKITQFGITWSFDRDYPAGQFANGDYWVVGPVRIVQITPGPVSTGSVVMHGSMLNPMPNGSQGYDSRIKQNKYDAALNVATSLPLVVPPGSSLLSSESYPAAAKGDNPQLKTIAVLTVLADPAPEGSFRPPYCGRDKRLEWNVDQLHFDRLRSLPLVASASTPDAVAKKFVRPWIEQKTNWTGRYMHPGANQPTYGREIAHTLAEGLLTLQLEFPVEEKRTLAIRLVQYGLDVYGAARLGARWGADGGHNAGRKMPLLLAGTLLDDPAILLYGDGHRFRIFQEDQQTWYVTALDVGRKLFTADGRPRLAYLLADIGLPEWGEKHALDPSRDGRNWNAYYRTVAGSCTIGHVLAARLMGLQDQWNWPATFDYYDRYWSMERNHVSRSANSIQPLVAQMWAGFRNSTAAAFMEDNIATSVWENHALEPLAGPFTIAFDLVASNDRIDGLTGLSEGDADDDGDLAASVRFSPSGFLEAANGASFQSATPFRYAGGVQYRVVMTVDPDARRYSVSVAAPGDEPTQIAKDWNFRSAVSAIDNLGFHSNDGYHAVLNIGVVPELSADSAPMVTRDNAALDVTLDAAAQLWGYDG